MNPIYLKWIWLNREKCIFFKSLPIIKQKCNFWGEIFLKEYVLQLSIIIIQKYRTKNLWISLLVLLFTNCIILDKPLYSETIFLILNQNDCTFQIDFIGPGKDRVNNVYENTLEIWKGILKYEAWLILHMYIFIIIIIISVIIYLLLINTWELRAKGNIYCAHLGDL